MKKLLMLFLAMALPFVLFAGGLVTNTNQSAMFTRFQCRDASLDIDAAYYNPAGLVHRNDGFYLSLNNQTMGQLNLITTDYSNIESEDQEYKGKVSIPVFPAGYAVFKSGRFALSAGVNPIAGDGKSKWSDGLPSYEMAISDFVPAIKERLELLDQTLTNLDGTTRTYGEITNYDVDISFETSSLSMGYQANVAYQINDYLSVAAGARLVHTRNWIRGQVNDLRVTYTDINGESQTSNAGDHLRTAASDYNTVDDTSAVATTTQVQLVQFANLIDSFTELEADVELSGYGITPIISINYAPSLYTNWSLKYEFKTDIDLETRIIDGKDANGKFIEGTKYIADIPAMLSIGVTRNKSPRFMYFAGIHYYFDKGIEFEGDVRDNIEMIKRNTYELAYGAEYQVNNKYRLSAGVLLSKPGVNARYYQNESRIALTSSTLGAGIGVRISPLIDLNLGGSYTLYKKDERQYEYDPEDGINPVTSVSEYYDKRKWVLSVGIDFLFGEL